MNKEVKEILDYLKEFIQEDRLEQINLNRYRIKQILDYITNLEQENERLLQIARKMHTWIFLHTGDEQEVYNELGLTQEENAKLGYSGQIKLKGSDE